MGTENNELLDGQQSDDEGIFGETLADGKKNTLKNTSATAEAR